MSERAPWGDFPAVIRNGNLGDLQKEPEYIAAKGGDPKAALDLVDRLITDETVQQIKDAIGNKRPLLLPVLAVEESGANKIPLMMAVVLGRRLGLDVERGVLQQEKVGRTNAGSDHRLVFNPTFVGSVKQGQSYLLLDDTLTMGGTIASLRGYIENRGGHVLGAAVMTAHPGALILPVKPAMLMAIEQKHGKAMDALWMETFGYGIDQLTQGEAGHLKKAASVDAMRTRIAEARDGRCLQLGAGGTRPQAIASGEAEPRVAASPSHELDKSDVIAEDLATTTFGYIAQQLGRRFEPGIMSEKAAFGILESKAPHHLETARQRTAMRHAEQEAAKEAPTPSPQEDAEQNNQNDSGVSAGHR